MTVTSIQEYNKKKVLVCLDGHLELPLYKSELKKYHLMVDAVLSEDVCAELMSILSKRVKLRAMQLLQKRSYTREKLKMKLLEGRYTKELIEEALDYVTAYGYVDDLRYAEEYIRCYCESRSKRRIMQDLFAKGVSGDTAEKAWCQYEALNQAIDESEQIMTLLQKKQFDIEHADYKEVTRMMNFLYRRGYSVENIKKCLYYQEFENIC